MFIDCSLVSPFSGKANPSFDRDESTQLIVTFSDSRNRCCFFANPLGGELFQGLHWSNAFLWLPTFAETTINHDIDIERSPTRRILEQRRSTPSAVAPSVTVLTEIRLWQQLGWVKCTLQRDQAVTSFSIHSDYILEDLQQSISRPGSSLGQPIIHHSSHRDVHTLHPVNSTTVLRERSLSPNLSVGWKLQLAFGMWGFEGIGKMSRGGMSRRKNV